MLNTSSAVTADQCQRQAGRFDHDPAVIRHNAGQPRFVLLQEERVIHRHQAFGQAIANLAANRARWDEQAVVEGLDDILEDDQPDDRASEKQDPLLAAGIAEQGRQRP